MSKITIIGAGPAGSSAAIRLARSGHSVRLYEKAIFPRPKLCGGFLSPECLEDLDDLDVLDALQDSGATRITRTVIASMQGTMIETALSRVALSSSREILDQLLLKQALASGVDVRSGEDGFNDESARDFTVVAAGRTLGTTPERILSPWYAGSETSYLGIQAFFENVKGISDQVELDLVCGGYVGLVRQQEGINVCALTTPEVMKKYGPSLDQVMIHWMEENPVLRDHLKAAKRLGHWKSVGPVRLGIRELTGPGTFYVGDAACAFDPFAGEGVAMGLYGSRLVAKALGQTQIAPEAAYEQLWRQAFMPALRWNAVMRLFYSANLLREPILHALRWFPQGMNWLTELTRYRPLKQGV